MPGYPCCCNPVVVNNCTEFYAWLATKTEVEITVAAELIGIGHSDCTDADCAAAIDGTYLLTKIPGSFGPTLCSTAVGATFSYTFSRNIDCVADDPYTGIAVDFFCSGTSVVVRCVYRYTSGGPACGVAYSGSISLPASLESGSIPPLSPGGAFTNPCVPTSANMPFAFV